MMKSTLGRQDNLKKGGETTLIALERKRKELRLSQEEVALKAGVSRQYYNSLENEKRKPSVTLAKKLARVLNVDWTIFFAD